MKTIAGIKKDIAELQENVRTEPKPSIQAKHKNKIEQLQVCINYLQTNPSPEYLTTEIDKIETKISQRMLGFNEDAYTKVDKKTLRKIKADYEKDYDVSKLRDQVRTLRYLLNGEE